MNENILTLKLANYLQEREGWGTQAGLVTLTKLKTALKVRRPAVNAVQISMQGVRRLDVTFAASALVALCAQYRGKLDICFVDLNDADIITNITAAAERMTIPVTIRTGQGLQVLGLAAGSTIHHALTFALAHPQGARATDYAQTTDISIANASARLKNLSDKGFLRREQRAASTGGSEFLYYPAL